jgi:hypothetical protein
VTATDVLAAELRLIIRLAARSADQLIGQLPAFSEFWRVAEAGGLDPAEQVRFILYTLIPEFTARLPRGPDGLAIRELLMWKDEDGQSQSLSTRYYKAATHLNLELADFGRRQEPRLLRECAGWFIRFDYEDRQGDCPPPSPTDGQLILPGDPAVGLVGLYACLDERRFAEDMREAESVTILSTWIPEMNGFADAFIEALTNGAHVEILMLHPDSAAAALRSAGLPGTVQARFHENRVRLGVRQCLAVLAAIAGVLDDDVLAQLRVGLYDSLPSVAVYGINDRLLVSVFLHGQLAVDAPQLEICGRDTMLGRNVFGELQSLWKIAHTFDDIRLWEDEIDDMRPSPGAGHDER